MGGALGIMKKEAFCYMDTELCLVEVFVGPSPNFSLVSKFLCNYQMVSW
jgi:hypothetical protein